MSCITTWTRDHYWSAASPTGHHARGRSVRLMAHRRRSSGRAVEGRREGFRPCGVAVPGAGSGQFRWAAARMPHVFGAAEQGRCDSGERRTSGSSTPAGLTHAQAVGPGSKAGTSAGDRSGRARCHRSGCRHRPALSRATSTPTSTTSSGSTRVTCRLSREPHPALNVHPTQGWSSPAWARRPATALPAVCGSVVLRLTYRRRPSVSYRPSSSVRGAAGEPVNAPTMPSSVLRAYGGCSPRTIRHAVRAGAEPLVA